MKFKDKKKLVWISALPAAFVVLMFFGKPEIQPVLAYQTPFVKNFTDFSILGYSPLGESMAALMVWGYWQTVLVAVLGRCLALAISFAGLFIAWAGVLPQFPFRNLFQNLKNPAARAGKNRQFGFFWMSRFSEAFMTIPSLLLALSLGYLIGEGFYTMIAVIGISEWAFNQKWLLGRLKEYQRYTFIEASEAMGGGRLHIFTRHFLPFIFSDLFFLFFLYLPGSLLTVTALEFLGLSSGSDIAGLGSIIALNKDLVFLFPHVVVPPAILIVLTVYITVAIKNNTESAIQVNS